jgi:S1-C subfamily serine protease
MRRDKMSANILSSVSAVLAIGATALPLAEAAAAPPRASDEVAGSVVKIDVSASVPNYQAPWQREQPETRRGSGAIVSGKRILTNAHVVRDDTLIEVQRVGDPRRYTAEVEHRCDPCDLALLTVSNPRFFEGVRALQIGELPRRQDQVDLFGFPEGGEGLSVTSGIVSRVETDYYAHSWARLLLAQVDAAINPGNSGGPAVSAGKLVGVAMQTLREAENVGYVVPAPVIQHFLDDVRDGRFDGFPELDITVQTLENPAMRQRLGLDLGDGGVLVVDVGQSGSAAGQIEPGDVILEMDGLAVLENSEVDLGKGLLLDSTYVEQRRQVGDLMKVKLQRAGHIRSEKIKMRALEPLIQLGGHDRGPSFLIYAGLVFQPLTIRYLEVFDEAPNHLWAYWVDPTLSNRSILGRDLASNPRSEVVVLTGLLPSEMTRGYGEFEDEVVHAVDGDPVQGLRHLAELLDSARNEYVNITMERGGAITLRRDRALRESPEILARYRVHTDRSRDLTALANQAN